MKGWGAFLQDNTCQGTWSQQESQLHINNLEMRTIKLALSHFDIPSMSHVLVASNNSTVAAYIQQWSLWKETESLFSLAVTRNISICARFIPGQMNVIAKDLFRARQILPMEWSLH